MFRQFIGGFVRLMVLAAFLGAGLGSAMAQAEPTMNQIYQAAQAGKLDEAQVMVQQVLISHPKSAKAHYVQAELFARQGLAGRGRDALLQADKLAPGLPFAKPEAVQALRAQLASKPGAPAVKEPANKTFGALEPAAPVAPSSFPLGLGLALGGAAIAVAFLLRRKKPVPVQTPAAAYAGPAGMPSTGTMGSDLNGPQTFGTAAAAAPGYGQQPYGSTRRRPAGWQQHWRKGSRRFGCRSGSRCRCDGRTSHWQKFLGQQRAKTGSPERQRSHWRPDSAR